MCSEAHLPEELDDDEREEAKALLVRFNQACADEQEAASLRSFLADELAAYGVEVDGGYD